MRYAAIPSALIAIAAVAAVPATPADAQTSGRHQVAGTYVGGGYSRTLDRNAGTGWSIHADINPYTGAPRTDLPVYAANPQLRGSVRREPERAAAPASDALRLTNRDPGETLGIGTPGNGGFRIERTESAALAGPVLNDGNADGGFGLNASASSSEVAPKDASPGGETLGSTVLESTALGSEKLGGETLGSTALGGARP